MSFKHLMLSAGFVKLH
uniref:Uncharacterized protein n=1 Tax=Rhizophora mucronata TaxID=61149 RepID=A0A2P2QDZ5_RHIMU